MGGQAFLNKLKTQYKGKKDMTRALKDVRTKNVVTIESHRTILEAARIISEKIIGGLPVLENERAVGIIASYRNLRSASATWQIQDSMF